MQPGTSLYALRGVSMALSLGKLLSAPIRDLPIAPVNTSLLYALLFNAFTFSNSIICKPSSSRKRGSNFRQDATKWDPRTREDDGQGNRKELFCSQI